MIDLAQLAQKGELFDGRYKLLRALSTAGGTADVWLALDANTVNDRERLLQPEPLTDEEVEDLQGLRVAIKIYRPKNALDIEGEQQFRDEFKIVFNCHHANLIHPTYFSIYKETPYLVLPYCKQGSAEMLIGKLTDTNEMWEFIGDVASGLAYLHASTPPIIHQDIKPGNVLIDDNRNYAITDFGISANFGRSHHLYYYDDEHSGTLAYMAPERFLENIEPLPQSDVWAFGATLYEILTGNVPFGESGGHSQKDDTPMPKLTGVPADVQRLIYACLHKDPDKRPTAKQIMEAAKARQYPVKSKGVIYGVLAFLALALIGGLAYMFLSQKQSNMELMQSLQVPPEEVYETALARMNSENPDSLKLGLEQMDSLSGTNYIPAIYQMAFTYGWYSDPISVKRKELLGIEMYDTYIPKVDLYSNKAVGYFTRIMELNDSAFANINANATYRLACYYVMPNSIYKPNYDKGKRILLKARDWATLAKDEDLLEKINRGLDTFE
ncbi:MAG: serine/threonine protein kinase [Prevotella sp.]|nr:serine/threonine protein kinase [Prevotella sp.]